MATTISRIHELANELDRLNIKNLGKRACNAIMANDMSVIFDCWMKCKDSLDTHRLLIGKRFWFSSTIALYTEVNRIIGGIRIEGLVMYLDQYIAFYKSILPFRP
jgi:hypothetical protein